MKRAIFALLILASCGSEDGCNSFGKGFGFGPSFKPRSGAGASTDLANLYAMSSPGGTGDRASIADSVGLEVTDGEMSFFLRFREDSTVGADALFAKFDEQATPDVASFVVDQTSCSGSPVRCQYRFNWCTASDCSTSRIATSARGPVTNLGWTCVGGSADVGNSLLNLYIDGADSNVTLSGTMGAWVDTNVEYAVGNRSGATSVRAGTSRFDDVIYWPNEVTSAQCQWELCNNRGSRTLPASCPAVTGFWCRMGDDDGGTGTTCTDYSGNGNDLTLSDNSFSNTTVPAAITEEAAATNNRTRQVVLVLGQSNAGGRGDLAELASSPFVQRFDNSAATWADETGDAADVGGGDVNILFATEEDEVDYMAFGYASPFDYLNFLNSGSGGTAGVGGTVAWEYWNGSTWAALTNVVDGTLGFTVVRTITAQNVAWATPGDWATTSLNSSAALYFVRARVTNVYSTNPIYDWVSGDQDLVWSNRSRIFLYDNNGPDSSPDGTENPAQEPFDTNAAPLSRYAASFDASAGTYTSAIPAFDSSTTGDVTLFPATEEDELDYFVVCARGPFDRILWDRTGGTQGVGGTIAVEYCTGQSGGVCNAWTAVSGLSDATTGFTAALGNGQTMSWTFPTDWVRTTVGSSPSSYCARMRVTQVYTTNPIATRGAFLTQAAGPWPTSAEASTVGGMMQMADDLAEAWPNHEIGVVPCPLGGTSSADWLTSHGQATRLFGECESRWAAAGLGSSTAEIAAIVIYQGEFEGNQAALAPLLAERWAATIQGIRDSIGRQVHAIVTVSPSTVPAGQTEWAVVRAEQAAICDLVPHCTVVAAPEGPLAADNTHFTTAGYLTLGTTWADAILDSAYGLLVTP